MFFWQKQNKLFHKCQKGKKMKEMFLSRTELQNVLPWSKNVVNKMIQKGIFVPIKNPVGGQRSKVFFWRPQIEEAVSAMINRKFYVENRIGGENGENL